MVFELLIMQWWSQKSKWKIIKCNKKYLDTNFMRKQMNIYNSSFLMRGFSRKGNILAFCPFSPQILVSTKLERATICTKLCELNFQRHYWLMKGVSFLWAKKVLSWWRLHWLQGKETNSNWVTEKFIVEVPWTKQLFR